MTSSTVMYLILKLLLGLDKLGIDYIVMANESVNRRIIIFIKICLHRDRVKITSFVFEL
jgi:Ribonuclease G/E